MSKLSIAELEDLKRRNPCHEVAVRYVALRPKGLGFVGPCPLHSKDAQARDSTSFECDADGWKCAVCADGGDVIKLVALASGLDPVRDFRKAVALLPNGPGPIDPAEAERAEAWRKGQAEKRAAEHNQWREQARGRAFDLWQRAGVFADTAGWRYLWLRLGAPAPDGIKLRYDAQARYYVEDRNEQGKKIWRLVHTGPAVVAAIQRDGRFLGCHRTYIDCENPPKFKAHIVDPKTGGVLNPKTMHGGKRGGHIALYGAAEPEIIVLGEGLEKTAAVWAALVESGRDVSNWAAWVAGDLGNIGGRAAATVPHPFLKSEKGRSLRVPGPAPDLAAPGILMPASARKAILLGDSTSDKFATQCAMARAALRFRHERAELQKVVCAWGPDGADFDDLLREAA